MTEQPLKNRIIEWLKEGEHWFQYAGNCILEQNSLSVVDLETIYQLFKEDKDLTPLALRRSPVSFNTISSDNLPSNHFQLQCIKNIENVNALASKQSIDIHPNLTLIYGGNGTGKSGYVRLLNNAFNSRGDKKLLPNVFASDEAGAPFCTFSFDFDSKITELQYPEHSSHAAFSKFEVFDSRCVQVHLEEDNKLNFTPIGFEFFEKLMALYTHLNEKLLEEINENQPLNEFDKHFTNDNQIKEIISSLGPDTDLAKVKDFSTITEDDTKAQEELARKWKDLKALDIPKKITELLILQRQIHLLRERYQNIIQVFKPDKLLFYKGLIEKYNTLEQLTNQEGVEKFQKYNIVGIGSAEWRNFIKASKDYTDSIIPQYPNKDDFCIYCLRPLEDKERNLIQSYLTLLKSQSTLELKSVSSQIEESLRMITDLIVPELDASSVLHKFINQNAEQLVAQWKTISIELRTAKQELLDSLRDKNWKASYELKENHLRSLGSVIQQIEYELADLSQKNPDKELSEIDKQLNFHRDKFVLQKTLRLVEDFVQRHRWARKAKSCLSAFNTRKITQKQGELFNYYITDRYTQIFQEEIEKIDAPKTVNIVQRNAKASTLRSLRVAGEGANDILSEGEQRAISVADFITETQINAENQGVFFDDPVTSQDHERKDKIAQRLVELAKQKQVIVFTHDISFFFSLGFYSDKLDVSSLQTTIRKVGNVPGVISSNLPWIAQKVNDRIKTLRKRLEDLKKVEKENDEDEYLFRAKGWYTLLREGWERAVEERLFKGVVQRFSIGVQTLRLKNIEITPSLITQVNDGMTRSSSWVHDAAAGLNPKPPSTAEAEADLKMLVDFATECKA